MNFRLKKSKQKKEIKFNASLFGLKNTKIRIQYQWLILWLAKKYKYKKRKRKIENLPEWASDPVKTDDTMSEEAQIKFKKSLERFKKLKGKWVCHNKNWVKLNTENWWTLVVLYATNKSKGLLSGSPLDLSIKQFIAIKQW